MHISLSDGTGQTFGGHLLKGGNLVYTTVELVIGECTNLKFVRVKDGATAWEELRIVNN